MSSTALRVFLMLLARPFFKLLTIFQTLWLHKNDSPVHKSQNSIGAMHFVMTRGCNWKDYALWSTFQRARKWHPLTGSCHVKGALWGLLVNKQRFFSHLVQLTKTVSLRANKNDELPSVPLKRLKSCFWNTVTCILYIVCYLPDFSDWCITVVLNDL